MSEASYSLRVDAGRHALGWHGVMTLIVTEAALFVYALFAYYYFAVQGGRAFFPASMPEFKLSGPNTIILLLSSGAAWFAQRGATAQRRGRAAFWLIVAIILGVVFLGVQAMEWQAKPYSISSNPYASFYFTVTGFHMAHVAVGVLILFFLLLWLLMGRIDERRNAPVAVGTAYWHFVDVVWLTVFFSFYIVPYLQVAS